jgi:hypothetical protein
MPRSRRASTAELRTVRASVAKIMRAVDRLASLLREAETAARRSGGESRRKPRLSPERRRALKLQGRYMGFMRQLGSRQKARVKSVKAAKGYAPAITLAKSLARKS